MHGSILHCQYYCGDHDARHWLLGLGQKVGDVIMWGKGSRLDAESSSLHCNLRDHPCKWLRPHRHRTRPIRLVLCLYPISNKLELSPTWRPWFVSHLPERFDRLTNVLKFVSTPHLSNGWEKLRTWPEPIATSLLRMSCAKVESC